MLLTYNNDVDVKGRAVFNAKQPCVWTTKEEKASTTA